MPESQQSPLMEVSTGIAQVYKVRYGRGPQKITAQYNGDDVLVCVLRGVNTPAQTALVGFGQTEVAQTVHHRLQMGMADEMREVVERVTGRTVAGYVPGFNAAVDATTDVFLLEPASG